MGVSGVGPGIGLVSCVISGFLGGYPKLTLAGPWPGIMRNSGDFGVFHGVCLTGPGGGFTLAWRGWVWWGYY